MKNTNKEINNHKDKLDKGMLSGASTCSTVSKFKAPVTEAFENWWIDNQELCESFYNKFGLKLSVERAWFGAHHVYKINPSTVDKCIPAVSIKLSVDLVDPSSGITAQQK